MKKIYHFPVLLLLVFSLFVAPSAGEVTEVAELTSLSNQVIADQSEIWYRESAWASIGPEGDIWSDVNLQGNSIGFDQLDIQNVIPQDIQDMFQWASMWTSPANHPNDRNLQLSFTFRTNLPDVAEAAAISIINTLGSQILMQSITFEGSNGYDQNYGNGFEAFTDVWFSGHVDWTNMQQVINNSIPRTYGGLAATIDATDASNLNFQVWMNGNELAASIGINFHRFIDSVEGGHSFSLADIFHVTQFSVASYASDLSIGIWLPDIGNLAVSLGNTTYSEVYIERWEADEPQQDYSNVHVYIRLLPGALESDISIGF
ncbi:MAG: hypothetical protein ACXAE3_09100, partial [Candidatus Kariarchaeaceae archaeon]